MPRQFLVYSGIRVTDLERSIRFYSEVLGLVEVRRGDNTKTGGGRYVLLRDPWSGQKLELNWYPPASPHAHPYHPGEGLDHIGFRVYDLDWFLKELKRRGVGDTGGVADHTLPTGTRVAYVQDPDGNWIELFEEPRQVAFEPGEGY
jgi:lactoylglutathione lyase